MTNTDYYAAYQRQKKARELAEKLLERRTNELYEANQSIVTAYRQLQNQKAQIIHQEKLASIGQLAAGVAHEINNPAGYVKSNLSSLRRYAVSMSSALIDLDKLALQSESLGNILTKWDLRHLVGDLGEIATESLEGISRIESIVKSLKTFARQDDAELQFFCINECIKDTLKIVKNQLELKAQVRLDLNEVPQILGQQGGISQVLMNLIVNSMQAIESAGEIAISTALFDQQLKIEIKDNGTGIEKDQLEKIFDPFYTTKEVGIGTGLGLSVSYSIIKNHKGSIAVTSTPGVETVFVILLPLTSDDYIQAE